MSTKLFVGCCLLYLLLFVHEIQNKPVADGNDDSPVALPLKDDKKERESIFEDREEEDEEEEEEEEGEEDESKYFDHCACLLMVRCQSILAACRLF